MTAWIHRIHIIVAAADREAANNMAVSIGSGGEAELLTFGVELSDDGNEPPTHYGCSTLMTTPMLLACQAHLQSGTIPSAKAYRIDANTETLLAGNSPTIQNSFGETWTWQRTMDDLGLQTVVRDI